MPLSKDHRDVVVKLLLCVIFQGAYLGFSARPSIGDTGMLTANQGNEVIINSWLNVAKRRELRTDDAADAAALLKELNWGHQIPLTETEIGKLELSIQRIIETSSARGGEHSWNKSNSYFLYASIASWLERRENSANPERDDEVLTSYLKVIEAIGSGAKSRLIEKIPLEQRQEYEPIVEEMVKKLQIELAARIRLLADDVLFPAIRRTIEQNVFDSIVQEVVSTREYPSPLDEPEEMMTTRKEKYLSELKNFYINCLWASLFKVCAPETKDTLRKPRAFGVMAVSLVGKSLNAYEWPFEVTLSAVPATQAVKESQKP